MRLNYEQNIEFVNDPRRLEAEKKMRDLVKRIHTTLNNECPNAGYYLSVLRPLINELERAQENLIIIEATIEAELTGKI